MNYTKEQIWQFLAEIPDPEIPVITIEELGVLRDVEILPDKVIVTITPTYTGCPAMKLFEDDIIKTLHSNGIENVEIKMVYSPAWTTDWMSDKAKEKLEKYGIAPPVSGSQ
ncbi:MAG TPA: phenylacetate-CoA oxygenase subunit PaaJ, partial [Vicingus sp.]|nr:phenylacetate-CoA oxygenase subunit PaaJ [Vicingus sp.]